MPSDLAILSAEQYGGAAFTTKAGKARESPLVFTDDWPQKRARKSSVDVVTEAPEDGEEEKRKRARGRPRLDTKDQTAAERRRTQIRLAQRAYRSRKESAIQSLERRVQGLQDTNEEMGNAFMQLHDFAVNMGLLEQAPEFARELRATTEKFLSLARRSSEDGGQDGQSDSPTQEVDRSPRRGRKESSSSPEVIETQPPREQIVLPWGGYLVRTEPEMPAIPVPDLPSAIPISTQAPLDYEIITMPTPENASFPFGLHQDSLFPDIFGQTQLPAAYPLPPFSALPLPSSLASAESTFGRRLQRTALERGYQLITMANPPKERFAKVFGFCMLFEPLDKIRERIRVSLDRGRVESLNNWQTPFWALGGAGQHQIQQDHNQGRVGNQGTEDHLKHAFPGGNFGLGPFDTKTAETWEKKIDPRMRITLPGFQGDFYDAEEVELYLQSRGVAIQPGQDYLTTQVDVASFEGGGAQGHQSMPGFDDWPQSLDDAFDLRPSSAALTPPSLSPGTGPATDSTPLTMPDMPSSNNAWSVHDGSTSSSGMGALQSQFPGFFTGNLSSPGGHEDDGSTLAFAGMTTRDSVAPENRKRLVTLDVNALIREIASRAVCLGRSPGWRPKDVNAAFWIATRGDGALGF